jgi:hypothetical protein
MSSVATASAAAVRVREQRPGVPARLWSLLANVKLGIVLLAVLTVASIAGTLIESAHDTATAQRLVYHALWFAALMVALALNVGVATWRTLVTVLRLPRARPLIARPEGFEALAAVRTLEVDATPEQVEAVLARHVGSASRDSRALFAQRGLIQRWGAILTHAGIILLLGGSAALSIMAHYQGGPGTTALWIGEGLTATTYLAPDPERPEYLHEVDLPFRARLLDFDADYFPHTQVPEAFTSTVELTAPDGQRSIHRVNMNQALQWNGWKLSQSSFVILDDNLAESDGNRFYSLDGDGFLHLLEEGRAAIELVDESSGRVYPVFDAAPGVAVPVPQSDLMFEITGETTWSLHRGETHLAEGSFAGAPAGGAYEARIDGFYPHYMLGAQGDSTLDAEIVNPAIRWALLENGREIGSDLAFGAEGFREMRFANLAVQAIFTGWEPETLTSWNPGEPIALRVQFVVSATDTVIEPEPVAVGATISLGASEDVAPLSSAATGFTARRVGRLPGAYTMLSVMREPAGLKAFFYASFLLFLGGPFLAFATSHCQVWALVDSARSRVLIGGRARGRRQALGTLLNRIQHDLEETA